VKHSYLASVLIATIVFLTNAHGQQPQIPSIQVCNDSLIKDSEGVVKIDVRNGGFKFGANVFCGAGEYPSGSVFVDISMTDSALTYFESIHLEQVTTTGKHSPMAVLNGRCISRPVVDGCRFWMILADNKRNREGTPDIVGFLVLSGSGERVAYGTGPLVDGDVFVNSTSN